MEKSYNTWDVLKLYGIYITSLRLSSGKETPKLRALASELFDRPFYERLRIYRDIRSCLLSAVNLNKIDEIQYWSKRLEEFCYKFL